MVLVLLTAASASAEVPAVIALAGPGGSRAAATRSLPARARAQAAQALRALERALPPERMLGNLERAREEARAQMASFTELERAETAVAQALAAAFDALPYLDDGSVVVRLAFDLAMVRLAQGDRDGAGEALGLSARLDPRLSCDPNEHPPQLVHLADEVRPPAASPPVPLAPPRVRTLGQLLGADEVMIARALPGGRVDLFLMSTQDGEASWYGMVEQDGRLSERVRTKLEEIGLLRRAPDGATSQDSQSGARPDGGGEPSTSPWLWLVPAIGATLILGGLAVVLAMPESRDDAQVTTVW